MEPDGRLLVFGEVSTPEGVRRQVGRLLPDGALDPAFTSRFPWLPEDQARVVAAQRQSDGKWIILVAGDYSRFHGLLVRLGHDGSVDDRFTPPLGGASTDEIHPPFILQPDGRILVTMADTVTQGVAVVRLNRDGSLDPQFYVIRRRANRGTIALQADGRILVAGLDSTGEVVELARYYAEGYGDATFQPARFERRHDTDLPEVHEVHAQSDGTVLINGRFNVVSGIPATNHVRLRPDGSVDTSFTPDDRADGLPPLRPGVSVIGSQPDGRLLASVRLNFSTGPQPSTIVRLDPASTERPGFELWGDADAFLPGRTTLDQSVEAYEAGPTSFRVRRLGDTTGHLVVMLRTHDGTARGGGDYVPLDTRLSFAPLEVEKRVHVEITVDQLGLVRADRQFWVELSDPSGVATVGIGPTFWRRRRQRASTTRLSSDLPRAMADDPARRRAASGGPGGLQLRSSRRLTRMLYS